MFASPLTTLLGLSLLAPPVSPPLPSCELGTRTIELHADVPPQAAEVCIRPGLSLNLFFDTKLARVDVEGRERFQRVTVAEDTLTLVASEQLPAGARVPVTVVFQDGDAPTRLTVILVVHPSQAERQVEVFRHVRTLESYQRGEHQARAEARQCQEEKERVQGGQTGLLGLLTQQWLGTQGVFVRTAPPSEQVGAREVQDVRSYRALGPFGHDLLALDVEISNRGEERWTPTGVSLLDARRRPLPGLRVAPLEPALPGKSMHVRVEVEVDRAQAQGDFTLEVRGQESDAGGLVVRGVRFPDPP